MHISQRKRKLQGGWAFLANPAFWTAAASVVGGLLGKKGQEDTNETNIQLQREANEFNRVEAEKQRVWSAGQADEAQVFSAQQAAMERDYNATQASAARAFNANEAAETRAFNAHEAFKQRQYATEMANTSYQRAVGDLRKAGLNPMLAYTQGGAPAPQGSAASGSNASGPAASAGGGARGSAPSGAVATGNAARVQSEVVAGLHAAQQAAQIRNIDADTELKKAAASRETSSARNLDEQTKKTSEDILHVKEQIQLTMKQGWNETTRGNLMEAQRLLALAQEKVNNGQLHVQDAQVALDKITTKLKELQQPEAEAYAKKFSGGYGENVTPYMREILDVLRVLIYGRSTAR